MNIRFIKAFVVVLAMAGHAPADVFHMPGGLTSLEFVTVGNPGNLPDTRVMNDGTSGYGAVPYFYGIGKYDVTNAQYCEFLNAVAKKDTYALYNSSMSTDAQGGIMRSGTSGNYSYSVKTDNGGVDMSDRPAVFVTFFSALRFANWLDNGQPMGAEDGTTTESGVYTLTGQTSVGPLPDHSTLSGKYVVPTENEWYKAAYHKNDGPTNHYWTYATRSDVLPTREAPPGGSNSANYAVSTVSPVDLGTNHVHLTEVGEYTLTRSAYGTFDQTGNVFQWNETFFPGSQDFRGSRGGAWWWSSNYLPASYRNYAGGTGFGQGLRIVVVPEPSALALVGVAAVGLLAMVWPRQRTGR
jgi:formylglycine-generating enzyme